MKKPANSAFKLRLWTLLTYPNASGKDSWFNIFIMVCILANTLVLMLEWDGQPKFFEEYLDVINNVFVVIFTIELVLKRLAYGVNIWKESWNRFDLIVVIGSIAGIALSFFLDQE